MCVTAANVSTPLEMKNAPAGGSRETTVSPAASTEIRKLRYDLQGWAHSLLDNVGRVCKCHRVASKSGARVSLDINGAARYRGIARCGDVWACPVCAPMVAAKRRDQVKTILTLAPMEGFKAVFVTYTCSHSRDDSLSDLIDLQMKAMSSFKGCRSVRSVRSSLGYLDYISTKEATWSKRNGWHPHQHELWFYNAEMAGDIDFKQLEHDLAVQWRKACLRRGLDASIENGFTLQTLDLTTTDGIDQYLTKSGTAAASLEMTSSHTKKGRKQNHYTPIELLDQSRKPGKRWMGDIWLEYVTAYKGRKQMMFGRTLLAAYKDYFGKEFDDDLQILGDIDDQKPDEIDVVTIPSGGMQALYSARRRVLVLELVEQGFISTAQDMVDRTYEEYGYYRYLRAITSDEFYQRTIMTDARRERLIDTREALSHCLFSEYEVTMQSCEVM